MRALQTSSWDQKTSDGFAFACSSEKQIIPNAYQHLLYRRYNPNIYQPILLYFLGSRQFLRSLLEVQKLQLLVKNFWKRRAPAMFLSVVQVQLNTRSLTRCIIHYNPIHPCFFLGFKKIFQIFPNLSCRCGCRDWS